MSDPFGLMQFAECEHKQLKCEKCGARSDIRSWSTFTGQNKEMMELREANESLTARLAEAEALLDSRAGKLLRKGKTFVVVAVDEPYFSFVYDLIRKQEKHKGRWTVEDEAAFQRVNEEVNALYAAKGGRDDA